MDADELRAKLARDFTIQAIGASDVGSPLYATLCNAIAASITGGGVCFDVLASRGEIPWEQALTLRLMGSVHRLALTGRAPELASFYPSCGGSVADGVIDAFFATVESNRDHIESELDWGVQTNEVGRSAALFEGLGAVQRATGLPLALREVGASAGLNLGLPWFRYVDAASAESPAPVSLAPTLPESSLPEASVADAPPVLASGRVGGDPLGDVVIADRWRGPIRPTFTPLSVADRAGCDPSPINAASEHGRLLLLGFLWPDQLERRARTIAAIDLLVSRPARIEAAAASQWLATELPSRPLGACTVVYHSIVWPYMTDEERARITDSMETAGAAATPERPLGWVSFEAKSALARNATLTVKLWDGSGSRQEWDHADTGFHGQWVELTSTR